MGLSLVILTGPSGSGKSTAKRAMEDHGFFCVDNLPTGLVRSLLKQLMEAKNCSKSSNSSCTRASSWSS